MNEAIKPKCWRLYVKSNDVALDKKMLTVCNMLLKKVSRSSPLYVAFVASTLWKDVGLVCPVLLM
jgi:hypothetical protein